MRKSMMLSQQHPELQLSPRNLGTASSGSIRLAMTQPSSSQLMEALKSKADTLDQQNMEETLAAERERCRSLALEDLANEKVTTGKFSGKTIREASEDPKYVMWLVTHQGTNPCFVGVITYNARVLASKKKETNSGGVPTKSDTNSVSDGWEMTDQMGSQDLVIPSHLAAQISIMAETVHRLKEQVALLEEASVQQTQMVYLALNKTVEYEAKYENLHHRISHLEASSTPVLK